MLKAKNIIASWIDLVNTIDYSLGHIVLSLYILFSYIILFESGFLLFVYFLTPVHTL